MKRIKEIRIQNFKAFQKEEVFPINRKNVLVYGNNGSGKSSFFWALYTLLQSSIKKNDEIQKYFKNYVTSDTATHQTLRNVFLPETDDSFLKLIAIDEETSKEDVYTISHGTINTNKSTDTLIQELNLSSDFINYKLLHNFYRASHKEEVNLWPVFERDIFPFLTDGTQNWLDDIIVKPTTDIPKTPRGYAVSSGRRSNYETQLGNLNDKIQNLLDEITTNANAFLKDHFFDGKDVVRISLKFAKKFTFELVRARIWDVQKQGYRHDQLQIKLDVELYDENKVGNWHRLERVQSFLNEAQLTRIAIGVRIGALRTRPLAESKFKILVLDDMLISLDLSNRMDIVRLFLNKEEKEDLRFFDQFQKFILTHDKGFFNLIRRNTNDEDWVYFDFHRDENQNKAPSVQENLTPLQTAIKNFEQNEFENAGNNLRLEAEAILASFVDPEMKNTARGFVSLKQKISEAYNLVVAENYAKFKRTFIKDWDIEKVRKITTDFESDATLLPGEIARLNSYKRYMLNLFVEMSGKNLIKEKVLEDIDEILDRILNPASHHSDNPLHRAELKDAIDKVKDLKEHLKV
ncbi:MAG: AAA family ATPase [Flavipsychrobacter sp.]|nr:AAA family ATPase [Flavipsychrobacter sp.]